MHGNTMIKPKFNNKTDIKSSVVLTARNLVKYFGRLKAVDNIDFTVGYNTIFGILGPNGAGKTTIIRMITGILSVPEKSEIKIFGYDLKKEPFRAKMQIGIVPEISNAFRELTVMQNIEFTGRIYGLSKITIEERANRLLKEYGLYNKKNDPVRTLSKGLKQRLSFCMALIHDPPLLIFDEPTSGLDPISIRLLRKNILALKERGKTIIMSTHDLHEAETLCDEVMILNKGRIIAKESPDNLKRRFARTTLIRFKVVSFTDPSTESLLIGELGYKKSIPIKGYRGPGKIPKNAIGTTVNITEEERTKKLTQWQDEWKVTDQPTNTKIGVNPPVIRERGVFYEKPCSDLLEEIYKLKLFLDKYGIKITDLTIKRMDLEDIFVKLIGEDNDVGK